MEKPHYTVAPRGRQWAVIKWGYLPNGACGEVFCYLSTKKEALEMVMVLMKVKKAG